MTGQSLGLKRLFGNLVDNAAKWSRHKVVIASQDLGASVCMSVEDDGPGIPEEYRERVFEVGTRLDEARDGVELSAGDTDADMIGAARQLRRG